MNDPWKHRSQGMRCRSGVWYVPKAQDMARAPELDGLGRPVEIGRCRRHAPSMNGFPAVFPSDWCGDHRLDENKLPTPAGP